MRKGQLWSIDLAISIFIFFSVMILVIFSWTHVTYQNQQQFNFNNMENIALMVSDSLVRTAGHPTDWNEITVETIGLASSENILDIDKINKFKDMDYYEAIETLNIYSNFYFELKDMDNNIIQNIGGENLTSGVYPPDNSSIIVPVERYCIYNGIIAKMIFMLWS